MKRVKWSPLCLAAIMAMSPMMAMAQEAARTIEIHAKRFAFDPSEITLKKGEPVKLLLSSDDVPHSLLIESLHVNAPMTKGHVTEVLLTPDKAGDFHGKCGRFCGSGHGKMVFTVHVTDQ